MITVKVHNDGKEKWQSFDASLDDSKSDIYLCGYGSNKEEAIEELKLNIKKKIEELQNINFDNITFVDCLGNPIQKT